MSHLLRLDPSIPLDTPKGPADAFLVIDYGEQHKLLFACFVRATGEQWTFANDEVRLEKNVTMGVRTGARSHRENVNDNPACGQCRAVQTADGVVHERACPQRARCHGENLNPPG